MGAAASGQKLPADGGHCPASGAVDCRHGGRGLVVAQPSRLPRLPVRYLQLCPHAVGGTRDSTNAAAALQVLLMGEQDFAVYMQAQHDASSSSGHRTPAFPSLLDMSTLEDAAEDDPDFCSDVCSVLLAALSSRVKLYAPAEAAARSADATGSYRLQCAAQVTAVYIRVQ